jgi:hypothetical protein
MSNKVQIASSTAKPELALLAQVREDMDTSKGRLRATPSTSLEDARLRKTTPFSIEGVLSTVGEQSRVRVKRK